MIGNPQTTVPPDENALPMDQLPERWAFLNVLVFSDGIFQCELRPTQSGADVSGRGSTPRAAMLAAIKAIGDV